MSEGRVMYTGPVADMAQHFASIGFPCPAQVSPAEHYGMMP